jgi:ribosome biogenesis GTPase / thiamine phosphate phosphatase
MNLFDLGLTNEIACCFENNNTGQYTLGRVTREDRERYIVSTGDKDYEAEITGNMRFTASSRSDYPAVGDWIMMTVYDPDMAVIHSILPRKSVLERQSVSSPGNKQMIAANVDTAFIVQSADSNFNINRLERYLVICQNSSIEPVMVISKTDLAGDQEILTAVNNLKSRDRKLKYLLVSNITGAGLDEISGLIEKGKTYCFLGSSGVGKSTLINNLFGKELLNTREISASTGKGRHTTSRRELILLENGGIIIDTPGMRELGLTDSEDGIVKTFDNITELAKNCRFPDCRHLNEKGCAVTEAVKKGLISSESLESFHKLQLEQQHFESTVAERRKKDKAFGKMVKTFKKDMRRFNSDQE